MYSTRTGTEPVPGTRTSVGSIVDPTFIVEICSVAEPEPTGAKVF